MAELLAILGVVLALEIAFTGILGTWWFVHPAGVERARLRVDRTPWRCFWLGCLAAVVALPLIATMFALPLVLTRIIGCFALLALLAFASLGATGLAARTSRRLTSQPDDGISSARLSVRRSLIAELALGLWLGGMATVIILPPAIVLLDLPLKLAWPAAWALFFAGLVVLGVASLLARKSLQPADRAFVRGATALVLASGFPVIGWFVLFPVAFLTSLGAAVFALLRWMPAEKARETSRTRGAVVSSVVVLWLLPLIAISGSAVAFFARGGVAMELASGFPPVGWLIAALIWIVTVVGGTVIALSRWGHWWKQPQSSGGRE